MNIKQIQKTFTGKALVYCQNAFNTPEGKTAHGLVRFTERFEIVGIIDSNYSGEDAGAILDNRPNGILIYKDFETAMSQLSKEKRSPSNFIVGLAPDGGRLPHAARVDIRKALENGMNVVSGLHDFISNDPELVQIAKDHHCLIKDVRKTPERDQLHFFTGEIEKVNALKLAILGTDSAVGKRTTAWLIVHALREMGYKAEMIGTGQTAWLQGAKYSMIMDSCINDFVSGEIEHAIVSAWKTEKPDVLIIEGQGSLMNPAYPGGFEILAAGRPDYVIVQHAPKRLEYDGFPGYKLHPIGEQINAIETISGKKVIAITLNHEGMKSEEIPLACVQLEKETGLPCFDVLENGAEELVHILKKKIK